VDIEFERLGLTELGARAETLLAEQLSEFPVEEYSATHAVHLAIENMLELARRPRGTLPLFDHQAGRLVRAFDEAHRAAVREQTEGGNDARSFDVPEVLGIGAGSYDRSHDSGLFVRHSAGGGAYTMDFGSSHGADGSSGSTALEMNVALGGFVRPNLAAHATLLGWIARDPDIDVADGATVPSVDRLLFVGLGAGATYYLMPANVYVSPSVGLGTVEASGDDGWETGFGGYVVDLTVGKEWWWQESWAVGVAFGVGYYSIPAGDGSDVSGTTGTLRLSLTRN
jgi:hypothetical protein